MAGGGGVQHVGFQHAVEGHALQGDRRRGVGQHVHVVLGVLAELGLGRVLEDRLERPQHGVAVELRRHAHIGVGDRHVGGLAGFDGEGHADHLGLLGVEAGGLGVEGDQFGAAQLVQPGVEARLVEDGLVAVLRRRRRGVVEQVGIARRGGRGLAQHLVEPALEFQLAVPLGQRGVVRRAGVQLLGVEVERHVGLDGRQLVGQVGHLAVFGELGRQRLGAADRQLGDLVEAGVEHVEAAADAGQQAQRGFLADPGDAGDVVDLVAHQRQVVDDQLGADAELGAHALDVVDAAGHGVDQGDVRADQLGHVLVAGGDHHVAALRGGLPGQGADHVVGLHALHAQQRQAEGAHAGVQRFDLHAQVVRHRRPVGLVFGEQLVAEGPTLGVEDHREGAVRVLLAQAFQHVQHALHRAGGQALGGGQRRQGVEGAIEVGGTVHQDQGSVRHERDQPFRRGRR
ncbi:hypothetical protein D9M70_336140 [compost metagenome]